MDENGDFCWHDDTSVRVYTKLTLLGRLSAHYFRGWNGRECQHRHVHYLPLHLWGWCVHGARWGSGKLAFFNC